MEKLYLVKPSLEYEKQAIEYIREFYEYNSEINGSGGLDRYIDDYNEWLKKIEEDKQRIPNEEKVPAETYFLVRYNDNKVIGMINIRLVLNKKLRELGGNIGYSIRPTERRKGYNKINLYLGLLCCKRHGINEVLLDCDKDNLGSSKTMVALGGVLVKEHYNVNCNCIVEDYIIDVNKSIEKYKDTYDLYVYRR